jgi:hypothetical protein
VKLNDVQRSEVKAKAKIYQEKDLKYGTRTPARDPPPHFRSVQSYIRWLKLHPDGAPGVFKSQFMFALLGMMVLLGLVSVVDLDFMSPGHTKFDPDLVAAVIGVLYNKSEVFNLGMLAALIKQKASCWTYNSVGLKCVKKALEKAKICRPVEKIQKCKRSE